MRVTRRLYLRVFCLVITAAIILAGDRRFVTFPEIRLGYTSDGGAALLEWSAHREFGGENIALEVYVYDEEDMMVEDLCTGGIDIAFLEDESILFDNKMTDIRIILVFRMEDHTDIAVCVKESMLEDDLELLFRFTNIIGLSNTENDVIMFPRPDEWIENYRKQGYKDDCIKEYLAPDFQMEALSQ